MKTLKSILIIVGLGSLMTASVHAQGTAFTYQGRLNSGTNVTSGSYDLRFALFDAATSGSQQGNLLTNSATAVTNGLFLVTLDFGNQFSGAPRWLEIAVRSNGVPTFATLTPRQAVTPTPYAVTAGNVTSGGLAGGTYGSAVIFSNVNNIFSGNGSNLTSLNASQLTNGTVPASVLGNAWKTTGNSNTTAGVNFLGTTDNQPLELWVNNQRAMRYQTASNIFYTSVNTIGGYSGNYVSNVVGATIGGGGAPNLGETNRIFSHFGTIAGGLNNVIGGSGLNIGATVGGGEDNNSSGTYTTVAGGADNVASGFDTTVGGGKGNSASGSDTTVGGGRLNFASGLYSTVPGGAGNVASGNYSFAAGRSANATNQGAFVWADSGFANFYSTANDQFLIRAAGGVGIGTSTPAKQLDVTGSAAGVPVGGSVDDSVFVRINNSAVDGGINNSDVAGIGFGHDSTREAIVGSTYGFDFLDFYVGGVLTSPAMRILGSGRVGIGTITPGAALNVVGTIGIGTTVNTTAKLSIDQTGGITQLELLKPGSGLGYQFATDANGLGICEHNIACGRFYIQNGTGNIGIGTASPANKLDVQGSADFFGKVGINTTNGLTDFHVVASQYGAKPAALFEVANCGLPCAQQDYQENIRLLNSNPNGQTGIGFLTAAGSTISTVPTAWIGTQYGCCIGNPNDLKFATKSGASLVDRVYIIGNTGNVGIGNNNPATKLDVAGEVTCTAINITSDRNAKEGFKPVNAREVLAKVASLPITEWQYKEQNNSRHIGPMAQDFSSAFSLGHDDKHISLVDEGGVALVAIQGLNEKLEEKNARIQELQESVDELKALVKQLAAKQAGGSN